MEQYANPAHEARVDERRRIAREVLVGVEVTRRELRAWVDDDGQELSVGEHAESPAAGTSVELSVPLSGHRRE
jgi:hypothetical protein